MTDAELLAEAQRLFDTLPTWADFQNAVFSQHDGLIAQAYPHLGERQKFCMTKTYRRLSEMRSEKMRETGVAEGATPIVHCYPMPDIDPKEMIRIPITPREETPIVNPITEEWLQSLHAQQGGLAYSILLPTVVDGQAIVEIEITPPIAGTSESWTVALVQNGGCDGDMSEHDDLVVITSREFRTQDDLREFCKGMGYQLP